MRERERERERERANNEAKKLYDILLTVQITVFSVRKIYQYHWDIFILFM